MAKMIERLHRVGAPRLGQEPAKASIIETWLGGEINAGEDADDHRFQKTRA